MPKLAVRIPQIGEGLQEARLVAVLKQPGDKVRRDEPIYQMETDKAVMDVESPYEGILAQWLAAVDTVLPIGAEVAMMEVVDGTPEMPAGHGAPASTATSSSASTASPSTGASMGERRLDIPPRTRAYAKEKGLSEEQLAQIPNNGGKLMPEDIDAYLVGGSSGAAASGTSGPKHAEKPLSQKQRILSSRLSRGSQLVVPGTITCVCNWEPIENLRTRIKASGDAFQPSSFTMFAFAAAQALKKYPMFRSTLVGDGTLRTYEHVQLGIAVSLPGDELVLAVVEDADSLDWQGFATRMRERIEQARAGKDQANEHTTLSLTNMQAFGLRDAVPVVVPPGIATLYLGEVYNGLAQNTTQLELQHQANLALTFDHRLINGVGAAEFLNAVRTNIETISSLVSGV